jgi:hypothetical protein
MAGKSGRSGPESSTNGSIPTAHWISCKLTGRKRRQSAVCGAFAEPSDGLEPSTPLLTMRRETVAVGCHQLRIGLFERFFERVPLATGCHRLRPLGSINAPSIRRDSDGQQAAAEQVGEACAAVEVDVPELLQRSNDLGDPARLISWRPLAAAAARTSRLKGENSTQGGGR